MVDQMKVIAGISVPDSQMAKAVTELRGERVATGREAAQGVGRPPRA